MKNVVIMTPALTKGDAVSNDVVGMAQQLRHMGYRVVLTVRWMTDDYPIIPLSKALDFLRDPEDILLYHHSIGCEEAIQIFEQARCRKIIKYHNVTPPQFFKSLNREVARGCAEGQKQLERILLPDVPVWCDSPFNGQDMQKIKPDHPFEVLAPFNQMNELLDAEADLASIALYDDWMTNILVVGRVVPNKNVTLAVESFATYRARHDPHARMIIVGDLLQNTYCKQVLEHIKDLGIAEHVIITGKISVEQLKAFYLTSQIFLTTSLHEGFCMPLVEAMGLQVPIVALPNGAIPDTAGDIACYAEANPGAIADRMMDVRNHVEDRENRLIQGWNRYMEHFTNEAIGKRFTRLFQQANQFWNSRQTSLVA